MELNPFAQHILRFINIHQGVTLHNLEHQHFVEKGYYDVEKYGTLEKNLMWLASNAMIHKASFHVGDKYVAMLLPAEAVFTGYR